MAFPNDYYGGLTPADPEPGSEFIGWRPQRFPDSPKYLVDNQHWTPTPPQQTVPHLHNPDSCSEGCPHAKLILCVLRDMHAHDQRTEAEAAPALLSNRLSNEIQEILMDCEAPGYKCPSCRTRRAPGDRHDPWRRTRSILGSVKKALSIKSLRKPFRPNPRKRESRDESRAGFPVIDRMSSQALPGRHVEELEGRSAVAMVDSAPCRAELWGSGEIVMSNSQASHQLAELSTADTFASPFQFNSSWSSGDLCPYELAGSEVVGRQQQSRLSQQHPSMLPSINTHVPNQLGQPRSAAPTSSSSLVSNMSWTSSTSSMNSLVSPYTSFAGSLDSSLQCSPITIGSIDGASACWAAHNMPFSISPTDIDDGMGQAGPAHMGPSVNTCDPGSSFPDSAMGSFCEQIPSTAGPPEWYGKTNLCNVNPPHIQFGQEQGPSELQGSVPTTHAKPLVTEVTRSYISPASVPRLEPQHPVSFRSPSANLSRPERLEETFMAIFRTFGDGDMIDIVTQISFHDVLQSGILMLSRLVREQPLCESMMGQHRFLYLVSAMAKELNGWLPEDFHFKLRELCSHISRSKQELPPRVVLIAAEYLLAGLEVRIKSALNHKTSTESQLNFNTTAQCHCLARETITVESVMQFFQRYRTLGPSYMKEAFHPSTNNRDLELSLMMAPVSLGAEAFAKNNVKDMFFFEEYLPDVRKLCNKHAPSCVSRPEHQLKAVSFLRDFFACRPDPDPRKLPRIVPKTADPLPKPTAGSHQKPTTHETADVPGPRESSAPDTAMPRTPASDPIHDSPAKRVCDVCRCPFGSDADRNKKWKRHQQSDRHLAALGQLDALRTRHVCPFPRADGSELCGTPFNRKDNFQGHVRNKHGKYVCVHEVVGSGAAEGEGGLCLRVFGSSGEREEHRRREHEGGRGGAQRLVPRGREEESGARLRRSGALASRPRGREVKRLRVRSGLNVRGLGEEGGKEVM